MILSIFTGLVGMASAQTDCEVVKAWLGGPGDLIIGTNCCSTAGITCDEQSPPRITSLSITSQWISASIPPNIGLLTELYYVDLSGNQFHGAIPPQISLLTNLTTLDLNFNRLTGSIPKEIALYQCFEN